MPFLEGEFALRLACDVTDADALSERDIRSMVDAVAPAIELVNTRFDNALGASGFSTVADNSAASAMVLGEAIEPPSDLSVLAVTMSADGEELASGTGAAVLGDPYRSLLWVLGHEVSRGREVKAGTWAITGTCTGLVPCPPGETVTASFDVLGDVQVTVAA